MHTITDNTPSHLLRAEWQQAAEELVHCAPEERKERMEMVQEVMGEFPEVVAAVRELFERRATAGEKEKDALAREYGERLFKLLVVNRKKPEQGEGEAQI